jgi:hypothetical protein
MNKKRLKEIYEYHQDHTDLQTAKEFGLKVSSLVQYLSMYKNRSKKKSKKKHERIGKRMFVIPDTQVKAGNSIEHIVAAANYCAEKKPDIILCLGDWWDMESLSVYSSKKESEGLRVLDDINAGKEAMDAFMGIVKKAYRKNMPRLVFTSGNHSATVRINRFLEDNPHLEGMLVDDTVEFLEDYGWEVYPFLEVVNIEGIRVSHYIVNPHSLRGNPLAGAIDTMLKNAGFSFIMGHQQTLKLGKHYLSDGSCRLGIVAGAFYQHDEKYMSPQGNKHWRGCLMLNELRDGAADICELSIEYLMKNYL